MLQNISPRQRHILLQLLENRPGLSIDALASVLAISRAAVQQHVAALEYEGYIKKNAHNKTAGRPVAIFGITDKGINYFPKQYAWFSDLLLSELRETLGAEGLKNYMQRLGIRLANTLLADFAGKSLEQRTGQLLAIMTELGFQVTAVEDAPAENPVIRANNCIYHDLAQKHPEICRFDTALMATLLDKEVGQTSCMAKGDCACHFQVRLTASDR